jgi:integrase
MSDGDFLSALAPRLGEFLALRRAGGCDAKSQRVLLRYLDRFLHQQHVNIPWLTREVVEDYLHSATHLNPRTQENRWCMLRQFCRYLRQFEPQCFVPEQKPWRLPARTRTAYIFSETEIQALLRAARALPPAGSLRAQTYFTLFGLLYTTGLRCGEAFALNVGDVDLEREQLFVDRGKFGKSRWVPFSASTARVLQTYLKERARVAPVATQSPFFITPTARRLYHTNVEYAFRAVLTRCGLRGGKGCPGPRLHHLRHSFACHRLLAWHRSAQDVGALLPALATYLGHVNIASTQVYLQPTAELLEEANQRFHRRFLKSISAIGEPA